MIFVDTSAWYARYTPRDVYHKSACAFHLANREPLITTDYVVDETLTLFKARGNYERALRLGPRLLDESLAHLQKIDSDDIEAAWTIFVQFDDKLWSFTDCVSLAVMRRLGINRAWAFDDHFRQFPDVEVLA